MEFKALRLEDMEKVREWRNDCMESLRTPFMLTKEMQEDYYKNVICDRNSNARMWAVYSGTDMVGIVGLSNIEWENGTAEINVIIDPHERGYGLGKKVVHELLRLGFEELRLENIYGECYLCNEAVAFWNKITSTYSGYTTMLPHRKFYKGAYHHSMYFNIGKEGFYGADNN